MPIIISGDPTKVVTLTGNQNKQITASNTTQNSSNGPSTGGLVVWYKADAITGVANEGSVLTWGDSSGNGNTLHRPALTDVAPKYVASSAAFGGRPCVDVSGTSGLWAYNTGLPSGSAARTVYTVASSAGGGIPQSLVNWGSRGGPNMWGWYYWSDGRGNLVGMQDGSAGPASFAPITMNRAYIFSSAYTQGSTTHSSLMYVDGVVQTGAGAFGSSSQVPNTTNTLPYDTSLINYPQSCTSPTFYLSSYPANTAGSIYSWNGKIAEVLIYNVAHNATQRAEVEAYLGAKYGITVT